MKKTCLANAIKEDKKTQNGSDNFLTGEMLELMKSIIVKNAKKNQQKNEQFFVQERSNESISNSKPLSLAQLSARYMFFSKILNI